MCGITVTVIVAVQRLRGAPDIRVCGSGSFINYVTREKVGGGFIQDERVRVLGQNTQKVGVRTSATRGRGVG